MADYAHSADWAALLVAARGGSAAARGRILNAFRPYLLAIADGFVDSDLRAKAGPSDLVQDSLLECEQNFYQFAGSQPDEMRAWLRQTLVFNAASFRRQFHTGAKRNVNREVPLPAGGPDGIPGEALPDDSTSPSGRAESREREEFIRKAVAALPDHYRAVIVWRQYDGLPFAQIGERLGRTEGAARLLWFRALQRLQRDVGAPP
jgi:RNA polymerase sigma-70 factor (ECF subfamily)